MKIIKFTKIALVALPLIIISSLVTRFSYAAEKVELQDFKCHVSLLGNNDTIYFGRLPKQSLKSVADGLKGRWILTILSKDKQQVYKVHECIFADKQFSNATARFIESSMPM